jgi:hypothetical protein
MNEKPGLEPGFLRAAGGLTGYALLPVPSTVLGVPLRGRARAWKRANSWKLAHYWRL